MKTSTKNAIKLVFAAIFGYAFLTTFVSIFQYNPNQEPSVRIFASIIHLLITLALLRSVYRANKEEQHLEKDKSSWFSDRAKIFIAAALGFCLFGGVIGSFFDSEQNLVASLIGALVVIVLYIPFVWWLLRSVYKNNNKIQQEKERQKI
ncbi:MAG TPA: hypothetical protein VF540_13540 [Segetibacter sp.]|jgi:Na+/H+ antiporter NhaD/arsenite permease-like protein